MLSLQCIEIGRCDYVVRTSEWSELRRLAVKHVAT